VSHEEVPIRKLKETNNMFSCQKCTHYSALNATRTQLDHIQGKCLTGGCASPCGETGMFTNCTIHTHAAQFLRITCL